MTTIPRNQRISKGGERAAKRAAGTTPNPRPASMMWWKVFH